MWLVVATIRTPSTSGWIPPFTRRRPLARGRYPSQFRSGSRSRDNGSLSLFKNFGFNQERGSNIQFRAEFFNVWNHTQFIGNSALNGISRNLGAGDFGKVTGAYDPRTIQLALKLSF